MPEGSTRRRAPSQAYLESFGLTSTWNSRSLKIKAQDADVDFVKSADEKEAKRWLAERKRHDKIFKDVLEL